MDRFKIKVSEGLKDEVPIRFKLEVKIGERAGVGVR